MDQIAPCLILHDSIPQELKTNVFSIPIGPNQIHEPLISFGLKYVSISLSGTKYAPGQSKVQ